MYANTNYILRLAYNM